MQILKRAKGLLEIEALQDKVVLGAGCGSVGSLFWLNFSYTIGLILLADPEVLGPENIERHWLGEEWLDKPKVDGVKAYLVNKGVPADRIIAYQGYAQDLMAQHDIDLVVVSIDSLSARKDIANLAWGKVPVIYGGVFPMGSGARVTFTDTDGPCFHCFWNKFGGEYTGKLDADYDIDPTTLTDDDGELHAVPALMASVSPAAAKMARFTKQFLMGEEILPQTWNIVYDHWKTMITLPLNRTAGDIARFIATQKKLGMVPTHRLVPADNRNLNWDIRNAIMSFELEEWDLCPLKGDEFAFDEL